MRVLLIYTNRERWPEPAPPVGTAWVAEGLRRAGHDVALLDLMYVDDADAAVREAVGRESPDLIALSMRNVDSTWMHQPNWTIPAMRELVDTVRAVHDGPILLGGAGPSLVVHEVLDALDLDMAVVGEGELVAPRIVEALESGGDLSAIPGIALRRPARLNNAVEHLEMWDHFAPAHDLVDYAPYIRDGGGVGIQSKRGCAFNCIYCNYPVLEGARYRRRDPERIADEIQSVMESQGVEHFGFTDSVFTFPRRHAREVCEAIARRDMGARWTCYANPSDLREDLVEVMARAGCHAVELGVDVADAEMLDNVNKGFDQGDLDRSVRALADRDISVGLYVLLGGPGETRASAERTLEFLHRFDDVDRVEAVIFTFGMRIYPGTELERLSREQGQVAPDDPLIEPRFYLSEGLTSADLDELVTEIRRYDRWLAPGDLVDGQDAFMVWAIRKYDIRPIWRMAEKTARLRERNRARSRKALKQDRR